MSAPMPVLKKPVGKRKGNRKLLSVLVLLFIILLSVLFFNSSISKISEIHIEGTAYTTTAEIGQAAAISVGDAFLVQRRQRSRKRLKRFRPLIMSPWTKLSLGR